MVQPRERERLLASLWLRAGFRVGRVRELEGAVVPARAAAPVRMQEGQDLRAHRLVRPHVLPEQVVDLVERRAERHEAAQPGEIVALYQRLHAATELVAGGPDPRRSEERRVGKECRSRWSPYH